MKIGFIHTKHTQESSTVIFNLMRQQFFRFTRKTLNLITRKQKSRTEHTQPTSLLFIVCLSRTLPLTHIHFYGFSVAS